MLVTISSQNQITLPSYALALLGVGKGKRMFVHVENGSVILRPIRKTVVDSLVGSISVPSEKRGVAFEKALQLSGKTISAPIAKQ